MRDQTIEEDGLADDRPSESAGDPRPLGRGLDEVSHLFLSARSAAAQAPAEASAEGPAPLNGEAMLGSRPGVVVLHPSKRLPSRDQVIAIFKELGTTLWEPLRPLATRVACDRAGEIDLLAADSANRLVIVEINPVEGDNLLLRAIIHYGWILQNPPPLRRICQEAGIDASLAPRAVLVAPRFPPLFRESIRHVKGPDMLCVRYHALDAGVGTGIFFERLDDDPVYAGPSSPDFLVT
jgi:hypothetical protein